MFITVDRLNILAQISYNCKLEEHLPLVLTRETFISHK